MNGRWQSVATRGLWLAALLGPTGAVAAEVADYVLRNGAIYTMDAARPTAQAVAVTGKEISYVGDDAGARAFVGKGTKVIDLKGRMVVPGFVESHIHPTTAFITEGADLQFDSVAEVLASVRKWADANPKARLVRGFGWRYSLFPTTGPTKEVLDKAFPDRPVFLFAIDGHSAWVNSRALALAGIDAKTPDPAPGFSYFQRDPKTGEPTGWLVEVPALQHAYRNLQPPNPTANVDALRDKLPQFAAAGITAVFDAGILTMPVEAGLAAYQRFERQNRLPMRVVASYYWNDPADPDPVGAVLRLREKYRSELVQVKALKINVDGGESQHTAVMLQPYFDRPGFHGDFLLDPKIIAAAVLKAQSIGLDTHAHSYGDGATRAYLDAIEAAKGAYPDSRSRHTAAHAIFLTDEEVARLAKLDVTMQTSVQWVTPDPGIENMTRILGRDLVFAEYGRVNSVLKAGGRVAFGTDWPAAGYVSTFLPLDAIQVAMTRKILPKYGKARFVEALPPEGERITLDQALKAYTLDAAYVLGIEDQVGSLTAGKLADIVVIDSDLHRIPVDRISLARVQLTMMNGRITHRNGI